MKTAKEWTDGLIASLQFASPGGSLERDMIEQAYFKCQADALRHVAKEINMMGLAANHPAIRNHCGMVAEALLIDAAKLDPK